MPLKCGSCRAAAKQSGREPGPERVRICVGAVEARILSAYDPTLLRIVRAAEMGSRWNPRRQWWTIAPEDTETLANDLNQAGFAVSITYDGPTWADSLLTDMCHRCAKDTMAALKTVFVPASPRWAELETAFASHLHAPELSGASCAACDSALPIHPRPSLPSRPAWSPTAPMGTPRA
jgi:hypothetical protein